MARRQKQLCIMDTKQVLYSNLTKFSDIFVSAYLPTDLRKPRYETSHANTWQGLRVCTFCHVDGPGKEQYCPNIPVFLDVHARYLLLSDIVKAFVVGDDSLNWSITVRTDGTALVVLSHSKIIGSRWIALIDAATIPTGK